MQLRTGTHRNAQKRTAPPNMTGGQKVAGSNPVTPINSGRFFSKAFTNISPKLPAFFWGRRAPGWKGLPYVLRHNDRVTLYAFAWFITVAPARFRREWQGGAA